MNTYTLHVLFGQRNERYEGQYAPEALAVMDEFGQHENPEYLESKLKEMTESKEFSALRVIKISVPFEAIESALNKQPEIKGTV